MSSPTMSFVLSPSPSPSPLPFPSPSPETSHTSIFLNLGMVVILINLFFFFYYFFKLVAAAPVQQRPPIIQLQPLHLSPPTATTTDTGHKSSQYKVSIGTVAFTYKSPAKKPSPGGRPADDKDDSCSICLEDFKVGDECRALVRCNHVYHKPCVDAWLARENGCPLCRASVHCSFSKDLDDIV